MTVLDTPKRLSQSRLWELNRRYYEMAGSAAWSGEVVPTQITSNAMIADAYAQLIAGYLRDVAAASGQDPAPVVTIVELGTGSGQFSFLLVQALRKAFDFQTAHAALAPYRYVMTDFTESNIDSWRAHPQLGPLLAGGEADAAVLDVDLPAEGRSVISGRLLRDDWQGGPVVLIANYLFDSLVTDAFHAKDGKLFEIEVGLEVDGFGPDPEPGPALFDAIRFTQHPVIAPAEVYPEADFNAVLADYASRLDEGNFLFPISGLRLLRAMQSLAPAGVLTIIADKCVTDIRTYRGNDDIDISETGAFSSTVNIDAIARWAGLNGGQAKLPQVSFPRFDIAAIVQGPIGQSGETELAYRRHIDALGPHHLHWLVNAVLAAPPPMTARALLSLLYASHCDPRVLLQHGDAYLARFETAKPGDRMRLANALVRCANNGFSFGDKSQLNWILGRMFRRIGLPNRALECLVSAEAPPVDLACEMALCHAEMGDALAARQCMDLALTGS